MDHTEEISEELLLQSKKAWENTTDYYTIIATGQTYPVRVFLQRWAFFWDVDRKAWINECATEWEKFRFERFVADGNWPGVKLEITKNSRQGYENEI